MTVNDYGAYADVQQDVNIRIVEALKNLGVEVAFPYAPPRMPVPDARGESAPVPSGD